jgi:TolA-binding protein
MSSLESDLLQPDRVGDDAPPPEAPVEEAAPVAEVPAEPADDDDAALEAQTIALPDGDKLVPLSAVTGARKTVQLLKAELATLKPSAQRATELEQQIQTLQGTIQQMQPVVQAYQAYINQQQAQPQAPAQPSAEDTAELEEVARDLDLYTADGKPDLEKARRQIERVEKRAEKIAQRVVAPMQAQDVQREANYMLARAKATKAPNGLAPDPKILEAVWAKVDPRLAASPDGAKHLWAQAYAFTHMQQTPGAAPAAPAAGTARDASGKFVPAAAAAPPPPLYTPKAGGAQGPAATALSTEEQKFLKASGMTEKEYLESAARMPGGRR